MRREFGRGAAVLGRRGGAGSGWRLNGRAQVVRFCAVCRALFTRSMMVFSEGGRMFLRFRDRRLISLGALEEIVPSTFNPQDRMWSVRAKRINSQAWITLFTSSEKERTEAYFDSRCEQLEKAGVVIVQKELEP